VSVAMLAVCAAQLSICISRKLFIANIDRQWQPVYTRLELLFVAL